MTKLIFYIIFIIVSTKSAFSQTGIITGRLILKTKLDSNLVPKNTYVLLNSKNKIDSTKVDENFLFKFTNLRSDTFWISFSPRSYPINEYYRIFLKDSESQHINIIYSLTCPYGESKICPVCKKDDKAIPIRYGLLAHKIGEEEEKYFPGGCIISECQPRWFCERDNMKF